MKRKHNQAANVPAPEKSARAVHKHFRMSPRKVRLVLDAIRHKPVFRARMLLMALNKKAARMAEKLLLSAVANAKVLGMDEKKLYVADVRADGGPTFKRFMERSMGRADRILKRTSHISMLLKEGTRSYDEGVATEAAEEKSSGSKKKTAKAKKASAAAAKSA